MSLSLAIQLFLEKAKQTHSLRELTHVSKSCGLFLNHEGREYLNVSSNNYLNLAESGALKQASKKAIEMYGSGSSASRLITGTNDLVIELESKTALFKKKEAALVFNSGYTANLGLIQSLNFNKPVFLADKWVHASIIDGLTFANAKFKRFRHNDLDHLEQLLTDLPTDQTKWVLVDSVYSMDGDIAPLKNLVKLKKKFQNTYLYIDEAHSTGVLGHSSRGLSEGYEDDVDIIMGTYSKALGSFGAFACCSAQLKMLILNSSRPFIYTTTLPPATLAANCESLNQIELNPNWGTALLDKAKMFRDELTTQGFDTLLSNTQIIPINVQENEAAVFLAEKLREDGFWATAIRNPTVPKGSSRVRLTLTREMRSEHLDRILESLKKHRNILKR